MEKYNQEDLITLLTNFNILSQTIDDIIKKKKYAERVYHVLKQTSLQSQSNSKISSLLLSLAEKLDPAYYHRLSFLIGYILEEKITSTQQIDIGIDFIKLKPADVSIEIKEFEEKVGVGIIISKEDIQKSVDKHLGVVRRELEAERYKFNSMNILHEVKKDFVYLDMKFAREILIEEIEKILGGKNNNEIREEEIRKELDLLKKQKKEADALKKKKDPLADDMIKGIEAKQEGLKVELKTIEEEYEKRVKQLKEEKLKESSNDKEENESETDKLFKIMGREMSSALNSEKLIKKHLEFTKGKVFTRFPPEPNGYLHIGHAKAMRFSFTSASKNGGYTYLRFDDTNPDKESNEFIDNIKENVKWLGYEPYKITYASDNFDFLYECAIELIKKGKAYVCNLPKEKVKEDREKMIDSPYRNRSVEENLDLFDKMKNGKFTEKEACLRLKIDMKHPNTTLRDPIIYRIKFVTHPHVGDKWCIYPIYDFTHCISDSLENITHSLCTLEFEVRRDLYYWILEQLDLYRPFVWEYSRLNLTTTVMSKRRLTHMVDEKIVRGWNDPRLFTINGLRRKGYTAEAINNFVDTVGVTRRGNENYISIKVLENAIKVDLDKKSSRTMAVIDPIEVIITNLNEKVEIKTPLFPKNKELGERTNHLTNKIYIERKDFKDIDDLDFFGLSPNQEVGLKYSGILKLKKINKNSNNEIVSIECEFSNEEKKTKGRIHWISDEDKVNAEIRWYNQLFKSDYPSALENWLDDINPDSEIIYKNSIVNKNIANSNLKAYDKFQFERIGFFVVDIDSDIENKKYVFNLTIKI